MPTQLTEPPGTVTARLLRALIAMGFTGSKLVAVIVAVGIAAIVAWYFGGARLFRWMKERIRALNVISGLATLTALFQLVRLCVFIVGQPLLPVRLLRGC